MRSLGSITHDNQGRATLDLTHTVNVTVTFLPDSHEVRCTCGRIKVFTGWRVRMPERRFAA